MQTPGNVASLEATQVSPYSPQPVDTSHVDLGERQYLVEGLARNAHEVWAEMRMRDGWTYGPERDDMRKLHPCLVRFEDLPEVDRAFDRSMIAEFLRAAILLGFHK